jgi:hypothetical protein
MRIPERNNEAAAYIDLPFLESGEKQQTEKVCTA